VRDLRKDLEICEKATKKFKLEDGSEPRYFGFTMIVLTDTYDNWKEDVKFVEESREGWPESINRAIAAEAEVERLNNIMSRVQLKLRRISKLRKLKSDYGEYKHQEEVNKLRAEVERLRKALRTISDIRYDTLNYDPGDAECMHKIAVSALEFKNGD